MDSKAVLRSKPRGSAQENVLERTKVVNMFSCKLLSSWCIHFAQKLALREFVGTLERA
ncbi:hypothetical protein M758_10G111900 [Ceratodon purpureus]|uniref:Uncharacterized protein n=1 Tax=Ceratodon purpureus TaxID=3225 RepID=A0A8T0GKR0_CERPU|nr:hypothetical protein KC19_10G115500 [Ceratodon purpureus]KAG0603667.1 hypothetical protein M758_10G111900 [Ceratodon purpureus]